MRIADSSENKHLTSGGITLKRVYTSENVAEKEPPLAGQFPFTRGIYPQGYREKLWTMRQYCGYGSAQETNKRFHYLIGHGETGLSLAFDLPTQLGVDPDDPQALGEIGKVGVSVSGIWDFEELFKNIDQSQVSLSMTINATAIIVYCLYYLLAQQKGLNPRALRGTLQNDILKEYMARGAYIFPMEASLRLTMDLIEFSLERTPLIYPISVSGYHIREAGASAVDELAFTLANALVYLEEAKKRGIPLEKFLSKVSFFFGVHSHMLEEIAKFRVARKLWAEILRERFGVRDDKLCHLRFHAQTCGSTLTSVEPMNNSVRVALQAMTAVLGGAQSLHTNSYDEALGIPTEESQLLALRTQQVLALETGVADTVDPLGGAYAIESLTAEIEHKVLERLQAIEAKGGMKEALRQGWLSQALAEEAYTLQKRVEAGQTKVVGVNCFSESAKLETPKSFKVDPSLQKRVLSGLKKQKSSRPQLQVQKSLEDLKRAAEANSNLIAPTLAALKLKATLGEIIQTLKEVFGVYTC